MRGGVVRTRAGLLMVLFVLAASAAACGDSSGDSSAPVFHEGDTISVKTGQQFVVALTANPSTGYSWQAAKNPKVQFVSSKQVNPNDAAIGASGTQELTFKAVESGTTTLRLAYYRPFEGGVPPLDTTSFPVTIKG